VTKPLSRRAILRGLGVSMALPLLDAMAPRGFVSEALGAAVGGAKKPPVRMAYIFLPNGMRMQDFTPTALGAGFPLPATLAPLKAVASEFSVLSGLALDGARAKGDGGGDHARSAAAFLTGAHPFKTNGANIKLGISVDQVAAMKVGQQTRLPSLELGLDKHMTAGNCDSGYSCAYVTNISWRGETSPVPKEHDPQAVFDRLFRASDFAKASEGQARRTLLRKSILDYVADDATALDKSLGKSDQRKMDEYLTSIREVEKRIEVTKDGAVGNFPDLDRPDSNPKAFAQHMKLMYDLMHLAFRLDLTRVCTYMIAKDGSDRVYRDIGVTEGHHTVSHHGADQKKLESISKIDLYNMQAFGYFLEKMKNTPEGNGTLLDNCAIMYGAGIGDGDRHNHDELPILLAGKAGGALKPGRHVRYPKNTPLCNLHLSMLNLMGVQQDRFGDSTGPLREG
jgi:hypothetical protein